MSRPQRCRCKSNRKSKHPLFQQSHRQHTLYPYCERLKPIFLSFQCKSDDLEIKPNSLEELKFVLRTISDIRDMSLRVENSFRDLDERYRVLVVYNLCVSDLIMFFQIFFFENDARNWKATHKEKHLIKQVLHYFQPNLEERDLVVTMPAMWDELVLKSKNIDASLITVKKKFTEVCFFIFTPYRLSRYSATSL